MPSVPPCPLPPRDGVSPSCVALPGMPRRMRFAEGGWHTVLDFLADRFAAVPRAEWIERMARGDVVDAAGQSVTPQTPYRSNLKVYYYRELATEQPLPFREDVLFQDDHIVVADKPHFLPVAPSGAYVQETLLVRLKRRLGIDTLSPVHRIDRDTAGLVLFAVQPAERDAYQALFRDRRIEKEYEAIAPWRAGLAFPLVRESRIVDGTPFFRVREEPGPPNACSHIDLIERMGPLARYRLVPVSGKRHQLRLHMAALCTPILNDAFYPEVVDPPEGDYSRPLQLLAKRLSFADPVTGEARAFTSRRTLGTTADASSST
jgi:tRNA pseudouridine32 synthase / 23S rRNA pseudouridine746 synthase